MALTTVETLALKSTHFCESSVAFKSAIEEVLRVDVRSRHQTQRMTSNEHINQLTLDNACIEYVFNGISDGGSINNTDLYISIVSISQCETGCSTT